MSEVNYRKDSNDADDFSNESCSNCMMLVVVGNYGDDEASFAAVVKCDTMVPAEMERNCQSAEVLELRELVVNNHSFGLLLHFHIQ